MHACDAYTHNQGVTWDFWGGWGSNPRPDGL